MMMMMRDDGTLIVYMYIYIDIEINYDGDDMILDTCNMWIWYISLSCDIYNKMMAEW